MNKPRILGLFAIISLGTAGPFVLAANSAAGPSTSSSSVQVFALGQSRPSGPVNVRELPRRYPNPDLLKLLKQQMAAGKSIGPSKPSGGGGGTPPPQTSPVNPLTFGSAGSFAGLGFLDGGGAVPPDTIVTAGTNGAVPPTTWLFEAVNLVGQFYTTNGTTGTALDLNACTPNPGLDSVSDPRVIYDSGRWFLSFITFSPIQDAAWDLIFSTGNDPATTQWLCLIVPTSAIKNPDGSTGNFPDFPKMGVSSDKLVITGDAFSAIQHLFSTSYKFQGTEFLVINKADLLNASVNGVVRINVFNPPQGDVAIEPAQELPASSAPSTLYMASVNSSPSSTTTLHVWTVNGVPGGIAPSVTQNAVTIHTLTHPPNAQQQGTSVLIDTNDDSLLDAVYRPSSGELWVSANDGCTPTGDTAVRSCARYTDILIPTKSVAQDFDLATKGKYYYFPAVRTNSAGDLVTVFTASSSAIIPSVYGAKRAKLDPNNTLTSIGVAHSGDTPYVVSPPRWGDYSGVGVDPNDNTWWIAGEYATNNFLFGPVWGTWIASVP